MKTPVDTLGPPRRREYKHHQQRVTVGDPRDARRGRSPAPPDPRPPQTDGRHSHDEDTYDRTTALAITRTRGPDRSAAASLHGSPVASARSKHEVGRDTQQCALSSRPLRIARSKLEGAHAHGLTHYPRPGRAGGERSNCRGSPSSPSFLPDRDARPGAWPGRFQAADGSQAGAERAARSAPSTRSPTGRDCHRPRRR